MPNPRTALLVLLSALGTVGPTTTEAAIGADDDVALDGLTWRCIGPYRGGRVTAVAGVTDEPHTYYMGSTGGGVWRTGNAGETWTNISDGHFGVGTIGAIAVAPSDANVIYVGTGEGPVRGVTTASGDGVYRSTDRGSTWTRVGLADSCQVPAIRVHPRDPDVAYVAAQGSPWGPGHERGVYRTRDGGHTWQRLLFVDDATGACDLAMDSTNPRILYAALWDHQRTPWQVRSGGPGSGLHKTTDGGDTWTRLEGGLPTTMGKIGVAVSPADPNRVWALVEAEAGGLFRSDDAGASWTLVNDHRSLRARAWYYMHVFADPVDRETVYVLNAPALRSIDGGKSFRRVTTPHGDNHALWINPHHPDWMINGNDGGACVTLDGGATWSTQTNQPTAQFYRVITDNRFPYRLYAGQQDNTTVSIASRTFDGGIGAGDWHSVGGGESAHVAFDPDDPRLVYATSIVGWITEFDSATRSVRNIGTYPQIGLGSNANAYRHRFNWNPPVVVSRHDPQTIYHAGNVLLRSRDRGSTWTEISPDLTRNERERHGNGGVPFTQEAAGAEIYNTIFAVAESPRTAGTIWIGTDDGLVHVTRDGGGTWSNVTPPRLGEAQINEIELSPHDADTVYLAVTRYKLDDPRPMIYRTGDGGATWTRIDAGLPEGAFVRVVREDPVRRGLLFAGTETGIWLSLDAGATWRSLQQKLPVTPITDLRVHEDDVVAATQGRAFWILDDISPLRQWAPEHAAAASHLYAPADAIRPVGAEGYLAEDRDKPGTNPPDGAVVYFRLGAVDDDTRVRLEFVDAAGAVVRMFSTDDDRDACYAASREPHAPTAASGTLEIEEGLNRFVWDLHRERVPCVPGHFTPMGWDGPRVAPGVYTVRLIVDEETSSARLLLLPDPRAPHGAADYAAQDEVVRGVYACLSSVHDAVNRMRDVRAQIEDRAERCADPAAEACRAAAAAIAAWEDTVIQSRRQTQQDMIAFENQLSMELHHLLGAADGNEPPVTRGIVERFGDLRARWLEAERAMERILETDVAALDAQLRGAGVPGVHVR